MQWRHSVPKRPEYGDRRTVRRFAWIPKRLSDGWTVWLEAYEVVEEFWKHRDYGSDCIVSEWIPVRSHVLVECGR
jgi:hypothetical protein